MELRLHVEQPGVEQPDVEQPDVEQPDVEQPDGWSICAEINGELEKRWYARCHLQISIRIKNMHPDTRGYIGIRVPIFEANYYGRPVE